MKTKKLLCYGLLLMAGLSTTAIAQDIASVSKRVEDSIKGKEPEWKLTFKYFEKDTCILKWQAAKPPYEEHFVQIYYGPSVKAAEERLKQEVGNMAIGTRNKPKDIGDEAYLWDRRRGSATLLLRKSNVCISVFARSEAQARKIAQHIIEVIPGG